MSHTVPPTLTGHHMHCILGSSSCLSRAEGSVQRAQKTSEDREKCFQSPTWAESLEGSGRWFLAGPESRTQV